jgi:hypothetical protein
MGSMIGGVAGFLIAVSAVSAGIFVLMTRAENRRIGGARGSSSSASDGGGGVGGDSGWSFASWVGFTDGGPSWDCGSSDSGSSDSGGDCGGGDGGGGDGGGGGGD